jgi:hypothetical protein
MNEIATVSTSEIAAQFQRSGLFPDLQSEAQAYVKVLAGQELGIGPMAAVAGLNVIKGRVTFSANLLASLVKSHPIYDYRVVSHTDTTCEIAFLQDGEKIGVSEFTIQDAKRAGLTGRAWSAYPKAMMFARALTQGVRWYCPDVTSGTPAYVPEEIAGDSGSEEIQEAEIVQSNQPREDRRINDLAALVDDYEFDDEQRSGLREFIREGGSEAIESAIHLLEEGNPSALFAGIEYQIEGDDPEGMLGR